MSAIDEVYEKYKHLDGCLSDPEWSTSGEGAAIYAIAGELWRAVKEARENPCEENGCTDIENCDEICQHSRIYSPVQMQQAIAQATKSSHEETLKSVEAIVHAERPGYISESGFEGFRRTLSIIEALRLARPEPTERDPE